MLSMTGLTIFCDFDGPIVDVSERYYTTYRLALDTLKVSYEAQGRSLTIHPMSRSQFWSLKRHRFPDVEIAARSGLRDPQIEPFLNQVKHLVNQTQLLHLDRMQSGADWALNLLHSRGARLILVTLRCRQQATQLLRDYGLLHLFADIYGSNDQNVAYLNVAEWKANLLRAAWHEHLCRYGRPLQSWMVGDTEADILAGQSVGIPTVALTCGIRSQSYLAKFNPTCMYNDLLTTAHSLPRSHSSARTDAYPCHGVSRSIA